MNGITMAARLMLTKESVTAVSTCTATNATASRDRGEAGHPSLPVHQHPDDHHRGQQDEADHAGGAARVPERGGRRDAAHQEPPEVTWPPPELDVGVDDGELRPDDELPDEFDVPDPLLDELELLDPELAELDPELPVLDLA